MTYRNPAFLSLAKKLPSCMGCDRPNVGNVVAAHSNRLEHGKGMGIRQPTPCGLACATAAISRSIKASGHTSAALSFGARPRCGPSGT